MEESPVDGSFDEEKFKRPVMKRSQIAVISSLHFGVSAQVSALACFIVPRVTFLSASRGHIAEAQGLLWLVVAVAHALARPMWAALSDRRSSRSWGRRRPYVVLGTVICGITFLALSVGGYHIPIAYYTLILSVYALGLSCLVVAWQALCAEIVRKVCASVFRKHRPFCFSKHLFNFRNKRGGYTCAKPCGPSLVSRSELVSFPASLI